VSRVVVTGVGAVSPVGATAAASYEALIAGRCGIAASSLALGDEFDARIAGEVKLDLAAVLGGKEARRHARYTQLALVAAREALTGAGFAEAGYEPHRIATVLGVGVGGLEAIEAAAHARLTQGARRVSPFGIPILIPNMGAAALAALVGAHGPSWCPATACASGAHAIGQAMQLLRGGGADAAICGGAEACITPLALACFARMGALSTSNADPEGAVRPFDRDRTGFVMAEGAVIFVLELEAAARRRGAPILGEVAGFGASCDAFHATQPAPDGRGAIACMRGALADARLAASDVDYVHAHGTGTRHNDGVEAAAISAVLAVDRVLVSSTKGATGHMLGASGAFGALVCLMAIQRGVVPPTRNLAHPDDGCALDLVPGVARERRPRVCITNSFAFGGQNASLVLSGVRTMGAA
jgi:3-oxoacyl-[acyl-carrier-protein] synthase II